MNPRNVRRSTAADTDLEKVGDRMLEARGDEDIRALVMLRKGDEYTVAAGGYDVDDTMGMVADALLHVQAMLNTVGKELRLAAVRPDGSISFMPGGRS